MNFFAIFLEFSLTRRVGTKRNDNTYFLSSSSLSKLFWLEMKPSLYFLIFWIFLLIFWNFLLRIGLERNGTIIFIFSLARPFPPYFGWKWCYNGFFQFFEFFCYFFGFFHYELGRNETEWSFLFSVFLSLSQHILVLNIAIMVFFLIFWIFFNYFGIFSSASGSNGTER